MALDTYANLKLAIAAWTGRADADSSGAADDGIDLFEAQFNRNTRVRKMLTSITSPTFASGAITHPSDWLQWKTLRNATSPYHIEVIADESLADIEERLMSGNAQYAIVRGTSTELHPTQTDVTGMRCVYYASLPALSGSQTTNWLLTAYPDAYLYGSLLALSSFVRDGPDTQKWGVAFDAVMAQIQDESDESTFGGSTLQIRNSR